MRAGPCAGKLWPGPRGSRSMEPPRTASLLRAELQLLLALALARLLLLLLTNGQYGFHRDELAVLDESRDLALGYVAHHPAVTLLAHEDVALSGNCMVAIAHLSPLSLGLSTRRDGR